MSKQFTSSAVRLALLSGAAAVGLMAASDANATAYGGSTLTVQNFAVSGLPAFGGFSFSGNSQAHLDNGTPTDTSASTPVRTSPFDSSGTPVDVIQSCLSTNVGQCTGFGQNNFALHSGSLGDFSRADGIITNTRINSTTGLGADGGGRFRAVAEAKVGSDSGNAVSNPNTQRWTFGTASFSTTTTVNFSMDADLLMQAILTAGENTGSGASAGATFSLQIDFSPVTSTTSFTSGTAHHAELIADATASVAVTTSPGSLTLDESDIQCSSGCDIALSNTVAGGGFNLLTWSEIIEAGSYNFIITTDVAAQATSVPAPEPATLSLLGVGLLGAGLAARRRRKS